MRRAKLRAKGKEFQHSVLHMLATHGLIDEASSAASWILKDQADQSGMVLEAALAIAAVLDQAKLGKCHAQPSMPQIWMMFLDQAKWMGRMILVVFRLMLQI